MYICSCILLTPIAWHFSIINLKLFSKPNKHHCFLLLLNQSPVLYIYAYANTQQRQMAQCIQWPCLSTSNGVWLHCLPSLCCSFTPVLAFCWYVVCHLCWWSIGIKCIVWMHNTMAMRLIRLIGAVILMLVQVAYSEIQIHICTDWVIRGILGKR